MTKATRGEAKRFVEAALEYKGGDCLNWPFHVSPKGYGRVRFRGVAMNAHRVVCIAAHGDPLEGQTEVAHSCGNRLCCNPKHLRHATSGENKQDMVAHGTLLRGAAAGRAKLTDEQAKAIKYGSGSSSEAAKEFGVSARAVRFIRQGVNWAHI